MKKIANLVGFIFFLSYSVLSQIPSAPGVTGNAENLSRETSDASQEFFTRVSPDGKFLLYNALETTYSLNLTNAKLRKTKHISRIWLYVFEKTKHIS